MTPEGKVKAYVRKELKQLGAYTFPVNQNGFSRRGIPDDFIVLNGRPAFIEFKAHIRWDKNNKTALSTMPTPLQIIEMDAARKAGMKTYVVDDTNCKDFVEQMQQRGQYSNPWCITFDIYNWYKDLSADKFKELQDDIAKARPALQDATLMPYEVVMMFYYREKENGK